MSPKVRINNGLRRNAMGSCTSCEVDVYENERSRAFYNSQADRRGSGRRGSNKSRRGSRDSQRAIEALGGALGELSDEDLNDITKFIEEVRTHKRFTRKVSHRPEASLTKIRELPILESSEEEVPAKKTSPKSPEMPRAGAVKRRFVPSLESDDLQSDTEFQLTTSTITTLSQYEMLKKQPQEIGLLLLGSSTEGVPAQGGKPGAVECTRNHGNITPLQEIQSHRLTDSEISIIQEKRRASLPQEEKALAAKIINEESTHDDTTGQCSEIAETGLTGADSENTGDGSTGTVLENMEGGTTGVIK